MALDQAMIAAGIGCKRGAPAADIEAAIRAALKRADIAADALDVIATIATKSAEPGLHAAADMLGVAVIIVPETTLITAGNRIATRSARVEALTGVGSVAEAAALAAAGAAARLLTARCAVGAATCALAASAPASGAAR